MAITDNKILTPITTIQSLSDNPTPSIITAAQLKAKFDESPELLRTKLNGVIDSIVNDYHGYNELTSQLNNIVNLRSYATLSDTLALQTALSVLEAKNGGTLILEQGKTYTLTQLLNINLTANGCLIIKGNGATIHFTSNIRYFLTGILSIGGTADGIKVVIENLNFNVDGVVPNWTLAQPNGGRGALFIQARQISVKNCYFSDLFYSAAIWTHYGEQVLIENCKGDRVGGRSFDNTEDARGDALYLGYLGINDNVNFREASVKISNCDFRGYDVVSDITNENSSHAGRGGIVVEFSATNKPTNVLVENTYFYNYQRNIHLENSDEIKLKIVNSMWEEFAIGVFINTSDCLLSLNIEDSSFIRTANVRQFASFISAFISANAVGGSINYAMNKITVSNSDFRIINGSTILCVNLTDGTNFKTIFNNCRFESNSNLETQLSNILFTNCEFISQKTEIKTGIANFENCVFNKKWDADTCFVSIDPSAITIGGLWLKPLYTKKCIFNNVRYSCVSSVLNDITVSHYNDTFYADSKFLGKPANPNFFISHYNVQTGEIEGCRFLNETGAIFSVTENSVTLKNGAIFNNNRLKNMSLVLTSQLIGNIISNYFLFTLNIDKPINLTSCRLVISKNIIAHSTAITVTNHITSDLTPIVKENNYEFNLDTNVSTLI